MKGLFYKNKKQFIIKNDTNINSVHFEDLLKRVEALYTGICMTPPPTFKDDFKKIEDRIADLEKKAEKFSTILKTSITQDQLLKRVEALYQMLSKTSTPIQEKEYKQDKIRLEEKIKQLEQDWVKIFKILSNYEQTTSIDLFNQPENEVMLNKSKLVQKTEINTSKQTHICPYCKKNIIYTDKNKISKCPNCSKPLLCPQKHNFLRLWEGKPRCWECGWTYD